MCVTTKPVSMTVLMHHYCPAAKRTYKVSLQSFEQLNPRAVAVVVDPIQSVKGKVVIDAFRSGSRPLNHLCLLKSCSITLFCAMPFAVALSRCILIP